MLNTAIMEAIDEWGEELGRVLAVETEAAADPLERFESIWTRVIESFDTHRTLWISSFEAFREVERSPDLRAQLADGQEEGRFGLVALFQGVDEDKVDGRAARTVGSFYLALVSGLMVQWLTDPSRAPSGHEVAEGLRTILESVRQEEETPRPSA